ncbi:MAG: M48 family metallopeptidase [Bdellovibrionales bacterium]|nr:M48 family metallopeptidase [Bdellovibrionales bacterium]
MKLGIRCIFLILLTTVASACALQRPPVPVGEVPPPRPVTVEEEQYGHQVLDALTQKFPLDYSHPRYNEVTSIVERLTASIGASQDPWHLFVFRDDTFKNAAATRGNHVFIWTAMIDATQNESELAAVLAHEIGHVLARHTDPDPNEEIRKLLINVGALAAGVAAARAAGPQAAQIASDLAQGLTNELGSGILVYPYSRDRELEADQVGLFLMADAGYDPQAAVDFWQRAQGDATFGSTLAFFSTHPPAEERLTRLQKLLPLARDRFTGKSPKNAAGGQLLAAPLPMSGRDTFDVSTPVGQLATEGSAWRVQAERAELYAAPDPNSVRLGAFKKSARVIAREEQEVWVRIEHPDRGWLRKEDLTLESSPPGTP